jgi:phosphoenolpyruvate carboxykinase (GTP)
MNRLQNEFLAQWVKSIAEVTTPDNIVVCDGSNEEMRALEAKMLADGTFIELKGIHIASFIARIRAMSLAPSSSRSSAPRRRTTPGPPTIG